MGKKQEKTEKKQEKSPQGPQKPEKSLEKVGKRESGREPEKDPVEGLEGDWERRDQKDTGRKRPGKEPEGDGDGYRNE